MGGAAALDALALSTGALSRRREVRNAGQLVRLCFYYATSGTSLRTTAAWGRSVLGVDMSDVALLGRLKMCGEFLEHLLGAVLTGAAQAAPDASWSGPPIRLVDGSIFAGPGKKGGRLRLHASYDPVAARFDKLELTQIKDGEAFSRTAVEAGAIAVADRNYAKTAELRSLSDQKAFFLVRSGLHAMQMIDPGTGMRLTSQDILDALGERGANEMTVALREAKPPRGQPPPPDLTVRLAILRASDKQSDRERARIERSRSKHGVTPKPETWDMAGVILLATNLDPDLWPVTRLTQLYRLRWQIELAFKTLKSTFRMRNTPAKDPELSRTWILANLLAAALANTLADALMGAVPPSGQQNPPSPAPV